MDVLRAGDKMHQVISKFLRDSLRPLETVIYCSVIEGPPGSLEGWMQRFRTYVCMVYHLGTWAHNMRLHLFPSRGKFLAVCRYLMNYACVSICCVLHKLCLLATLGHVCCFRHYCMLNLVRGSNFTNCWASV